jgi:hypothetical protein
VTVSIESIKETKTRKDSKSDKETKSRKEFESREVSKLSKIMSLDGKGQGRGQDG